MAERVSVSMSIEEWRRLESEAVSPDLKERIAMALRARKRRIQKRTPAALTDENRAALDMTYRDFEKMWPSTQLSLWMCDYAEARRFQKPYFAIFASRTEEEWLAEKGFKPAWVKWFKQVFEPLGLSFGMDLKDWKPPKEL